MSQQEQYWQYQQLELEHHFKWGNAKRWGLLTLPEPRRIYTGPAEPERRLTENEQDAAQDSYLESKGVPVGRREVY